MQPASHRQPSRTEFFSRSATVKLVAPLVTAGHGVSRWLWLPRQSLLRARSCLGPLETLTSVGSRRSAQANCPDPGHQWAATRGAVHSGAAHWLPLEARGLTFEPQPPQVPTTWSNRSDTAGIAPVPRNHGPSLRTPPLHCQSSGLQQASVPEVLPGAPTRRCARAIAAQRLRGHG